MATFLSNSAPQHTEDNLPALPPYLQSEAHLTAHLASRFHLNLPTAKLSSHAFVSFNTYTSSARGPNGSKDGSAMAAAEDMAARAWARLGSRGENQAVLFLGESGSGKTTLRSHFLSSILSLSSTPLSNKLSYAAFLFDALTTTKSITTPTASKAGLFYELQYDTTSSSQPTLIGGKLLGHRLERKRLAAVPIGERSFHIMYYLLAGTSAAEKHHLGLEESSHTPADAITHGFGHGNGQKRWRYLGNPTQLKVGINDAEGFQQFKSALRSLEIPRSDIAEICQVLATVMHIGQLEFATVESTAPAPDESGGYSHEGGEQVTVVKNRDTLATIAAFLGVSVNDLETSLSYKTQTLHRERVTIMLDPTGARKNADELAQTLYSLLVSYIIEQVNQKVCAFEDGIGNTVSVVDFPGFAQSSSTTGSTLDQLLNNAATESLYQYTLKSFYEQQAEILEAEDIPVPPTSYFDNSDAVTGLLKRGNGLLSIVDDQMKRGKTDLQCLEALRKRFETKNMAIEVSEAYSKLPGSNFTSPNSQASFTVKHFAGEVEYPITGLLEDNADVVSGDLVNLIQSSRSDFVRSIFGQEALHTVSHPQEKTSVLQATLSSKPSRKPSVARRRGSVKPVRSRPSRAFDDESDDGKKKTNPFRDRSTGPHTISQGAAGEFLSSLSTMTDALSNPNTNAYFVFCLKPNDRRIAKQFDSNCVRSQLQTFGIAEMSQRLKSIDFSVFMPFGEFLGQTSQEDDFFVGSEREKAERFLADKRWPENEARAGTTGVLLSERCWAEIADVNKGAFPESRYRDNSMDDDRSGAVTPVPRLPGNDSRLHLLGTPSPGYHDDKAAGYFGRDLDTRSDAGTAFVSGDMFRNFDTRQELAVKGNEKKLEEVDDVVVSGSRKRWVFLVWALTFFVPDFLIKSLGRIKRKDIRMAWREKLAINMLIWALCAFVIFFIVLFPKLICPTQHVFSDEELSSFDGKMGKDAYVAIRGVVFDLSNFMQAHYPSIIPDSALEKYAGKDATNLFPIQVSAMCQGVSGTIDPAVQISYQTANYTLQKTLTSSSDPNARYHDFRWATGANNYRPTWFTEQMLGLEKSYYKGFIGFPPSYLKTLASTDSYIGYINGRVYDFTSYVRGAAPPQYPPGQNATTLPNSAFMDADVVNLFTQQAGGDLTQQWLALDMDADLRSRMQLCLDNIFFVGKLDTRSSAKCQFAEYVMLAVSVLLASVIGFKFLAALQFGSNNMPENLDKFIICTVPAYTEDEDSLRRAIDSAARMQYDDKRKLLIIVCDGMIIGQGNDRPTPRIVLDILGVPEDIDPQPLSFESLGEGQKQHNMGKVYSGLYEVAGHVVPFMVIVKIGKPSEVSRPGNRGKRDSQMILMRFLNRVHYNLPMSPLELEMHHQIRDIIGINPIFYDFLLQIDADTVVAPDSATRFVGAMLHDTRLIGVCGETALSNAKSSIVTMMQVYEYYISHNLTKAFESLFGSVTCLPGCFTMVRIRAADTGKPLFVSKEIVEAYSEIRVDTLHMKNLLHLGEDRYLTTLLLKFHPKYKTKYIFRAHAWTIAPESWKVFFSQRRRWINSTVHNLIELIPLQQLCGFFCFSMRFVVFLDLLSTIVQPVIVGYIAYLIYLIISNPSSVPVTAFILIGAIYGLQAIIFILRRRWEMCLWMIIYILATPIFACIMPMMSFWEMDDFSWGNTRVVTGESGRQVVVSDEGKFDPASIPKKRWEEYQAELLEAQSQAYSDHMTETGNMPDDMRSQVSGMTYATKNGFGLGGGYAAQAAKSEYNVNVAPYHDNATYSPQGTGQQTPTANRFSSTLSLLRPAGTSPQPADYPYTPPAYNNNTTNNTNTPSYLPASRPLSTFEMSDMHTASRPVSTLLAPGTGAGMGHARQPSDDALLSAIKEIVATADLMTVTKKSVKSSLEARFGLQPGALNARRAYIGSATEAVLGGML